MRQETLAGQVETIGESKALTSRAFGILGLKSPRHKHENLLQDVRDESLKVLHPTNKRLDIVGAPCKFARQLGLWCTIYGLSAVDRLLLTIRDVADAGFDAPAGVDINQLCFFEAKHLYLHQSRKPDLAFTTDGKHLVSLSSMPDSTAQHLAFALLGGMRARTVKLQHRNRGVATGGVSRWHSASAVFFSRSLTGAGMSRS